MTWVGQSSNPQGAVSRRRLLQGIALAPMCASPIVHKASLAAFLDASGIHPGVIIDVRDFGAVFDGRDNTLALRSAVVEAAASPELKTIHFPAGDCLLSGTINFPSGVRAVGQGAVNTRFRRVGNYGDTFTFGVDGTYVSGGAEGFMIYQDHGTGFFPPNVGRDFRNLVTWGAHFNIAPDSHCRWADLLLIGMTYQIRRRGGLASKFDQVDCYGIYDPVEPAMQETRASILIEGDLSAIPTDIEFISCRISGMLSPVRRIAWPGNNFTDSTVQNAGPQYGLQIECCEGVRWFGGYIGAAADSGVRLMADPKTILSGFALAGAFVDSCGNAGLSIDGSRGGTASQVSWGPSEHNSQGNGLCAITDMTGEDKRGERASVVGLDVSGQYRAQIGSGITLAAARAVRISAVARSWNAKGFYPPSSSGAAFAVVGSACRGVVMSGMYGGGPDGAGGGHDAVAIRYPRGAANTAKVFLNGLGSGVGTIESGEL